MTDQAPPSRTSLIPVPRQRTVIEKIWEWFLELLRHVGELSDMAAGAVRAIFRRPLEGREIIAQVESLGVATMPIDATPSDST